MKKDAMRIRYTLVALLFVFASSLSMVSGQKVKYIKVPELEKILNNSDGILYVVNFWATWCPPCVAELPAFEKISKEYDPGKVRFILVSLDFPSQIEKQLLPFLKKNNIKNDVAVMMETDYDLWIEKVDPSWQGNIPATLFLNNTKNIRGFHPEVLDEKGLRSLLNSYL